MDENLLSILTLNIPEKVYLDDGFLEITGQQYRENINSRVYAYFLSQNNYPSVAEKFLTSLLDLIQLKSGKELILEQYSCLTEERTSKGNRIDITLNDPDNKSAIVIENKINHIVANDLEDYWNHYKYLDENKIGILLTLERHEIPDYVLGKFINITHIEWINHMRKNGLASNLPNKVYTYLNDFFQTIENITKNHEMNDQTRFFFQHPRQMIKAAETVGEANKFINQQLESLAANLNLSTHGKTNVWRNIWDSDNKRKTFYTILFDRLLNGDQTIEVIIELELEDKEKTPELRKLLKDDPLYQDMNLSGYSTERFIHFARKEYKLNIEQIQNFADHVHTIILNEFEPVMIKILDYIDSHKTN